MKTITKKLYLFIALTFAAGSLFSQGANPCVATAISVGGSCSSTTATVSGTDSGIPGAPSCASYSGGPDVWYSFTVPASGDVTITTTAGSITDGGMAIYSGACGSPTEIECDDDDGTGLMPEIIRSGLTPGATIFIRLWEYGGGTGTMDLCVVDNGAGGGGAAGDDPCTATPLTVNGACIMSTYNNTTATATAGVPAPGCANYSGGDVWFTALVPASGHLIVETGTGVITDGGMAIYTAASCAGPFTLVECDDDDGTGLMPMIDNNTLTPATTVYIRVWEYGNDNNGSFDICAYDGGGGSGNCSNACAGCAAPMISHATHTETTGPNGCDDCSSALIPFGFTWDLCGTPYSGAYINSNGNITFGSSYTTYTPVGMPNATTAVMVAPFWADVDMSAACGVICHDNSTGTRFVVTWADVGYYNSHCDKLNSFQLILSDGTDATIGAGNNVGFLYGDMQWTTGDITGTGGFGGAPAVNGINSNDGITAWVYGEYDHAGTDFDGPGGSVDGVDHLDNLSLTFATSSGSCILPVDFIKVTTEALADQSAIKVNWETNSQANLAGFYVERSTDGTSFSTIKHLNGFGPNDQNTIHYDYNDVSAEKNVLYYYRIREIAPNGREHFSPIVTGIISDIPNVQVGKLYPNPAAKNDVIVLPIASSVDTKVTFQIFDQLGNKVYEERKVLGIGDNEILFNPNILESGVYYSKVIVDRYQSQPQKLVIQK